MNEAWLNYQKATAEGQPSETAEKAIELFNGATGKVIDLGCGSGRDAIYFLSQGWDVLAIDKETDFLQEICQNMPEDQRKHFTLKNMCFEELNLPKVDFIHAAFSLPFCNPARFDEMWNVIKESINAGGRFAGTFFGKGILAKKDFSDTRTFHSSEEVKGLFRGFEMELFKEDEFDGQCCGEDGELIPKHWHIFYVVARKL